MPASVVRAHYRKGTRGVRRHVRVIEVEVPLGATHPSFARLLAERHRELERAAFGEVNPRGGLELDPIEKDVVFYAPALAGEVVRMRVAGRNAPQE